MGFCYYNNAGVAARAAQDALARMQQQRRQQQSQDRVPGSSSASGAPTAAAAAGGSGASSTPAAEKPRVLILDWDIHHGEAWMAFNTIHSNGVVLLEAVRGCSYSYS